MGYHGKAKDSKKFNKKKTPSKIVQRKNKMTIRIQAKPPTEKQTSKEERKPKQSEKAMKPCKM